MGAAAFQRYRRRARERLQGEACAALNPPTEELFERRDDDDAQRAARSEFAPDETPKSASPLADCESDDGADLEPQGSASAPSRDASSSSELPTAPAASGNASAAPDGVTAVGRPPPTDKRRGPR
jgi:hypothetical protein